MLPTSVRIQPRAIAPRFSVNHCDRPSALASSSLVIVDRSLAGDRSLMDAIPVSVRVVVLCDGEDAIAQITAALEHSPHPVASLHLLSHGAPGKIILGNHILSGDTLSRYSIQLSRWREVFSEGGEILIYGCEVASTEAGKAFLQQLQQLTGANIAASTTLTGSPEFGGSSELEFQLGAITAPLISTHNYQGVLADIEVTNTDDSGSGSLRAALAQAEGTAEADTIIFTGSIFTNTTDDEITLTSGELAYSTTTAGNHVTIQAPGHAMLTVSGNNASRVFGFNGVADITIDGLAIANGSSGFFADGSGINNSSTGTVNVINTIIVGNSTNFGDGAGINNSSTGTVNVINTIIVGNNAAGAFGGGIKNGSTGTVNITNTAITSNTAADGGGIDNRSTGTVNVTNTAITSNTAKVGDGGGINNFFTGTVNVTNTAITFNTAKIADGDGGGINNDSTGTVNITNTTITSNTADGDGSGINNDSTGTVNITNTTITSNTADGDGGGINNDSTGTVEVKNTIIAGNTASKDNDVSGTFTSNSKNIIGDVGISTGFGGTDITGVAASTVIDTNLADNGGPTQTHALVAGSPALDTGNNTDIAGSITTDQRGTGFARIFNGTVDIGAYEEQVPDIAFSSGTIAAANVSQSTTDHPLYQLDLAVTTADAQLTGATFTTAGTYTTSDIAANSFELFYSTDTIFDAGDTSLGTQGVVASGSSLAFTGLSQTINNGDTGTLFLVADIDIGATAGNTINITAPTLADVTFSAGNKSGTPTAAGVQTIEALSTEVTNTDDSGAGSLRQALINAELLPGADTITFTGSPFTNATDDTIALTTGELTYNGAAGNDVTIQAPGNASLTVNGSSLSRVFNINSAANVTLDGLTITNGKTSGNGGGILKQGAGMLTVLNSTVNNNTTSGNGGGIYNDSGSTLTVTNSTISTNMASRGGGIRNRGTLTVNNSTITANNATLAGGIDNTGTANLNNTIVAGNADSSGFPDVFGTFNSNNHNLIGNPAGSTSFGSDTTGVAVGTVIGSLADNGGTTQTYALVAGSPALNAGDNADIPGSITTDQRGTGFDRIKFGTVDIGAYEEQTPPLIISEIMYDPNSTEDNWEWVEVYNSGNSTVDLSGYVLDDNNSLAHGSANIASGTITAGGSAILFNDDKLDASDFEAAWGTGINLIGVTGWSNIELNNTGEKVGLWDSFTSYSGDNTAHAKAFETVDYGSAGFPDPVGASIYLTNLTADNTVGSNWGTSTAGGSTPLGTGYLSADAGGNSGSDIGSPGGTLSAVTLSSGTIPTANVLQGTTNHPLYQLDLAVATANAQLTGATFTTNGTYATSDIVPNSFELFYSTDTTFDAGDSSLGTQAVVTSGNTLAFTGLSQTINSGSTGTLFLVADIASGATIGNTINIDAPTLSNITFTSASKTGTLSASGAQTFDALPTITSITRLSPASNPTNANTLIFRATFSEDVQNVGTADFNVNGSTSATATNVSTVSANVYDITVSGGDLASFNGTVGLDLAAAQDIADNTGNALPSGEPTTDETYSLDNTTPSLTSFTRLSPASNPTNANTLIFRATFSEDVQNVSPADFAVSGGTSATATNVSTVSASVYDITVSGGDLASFNGTVGLDLAGGQDITDNVGNGLPGTEPTTDETYTLENVAPSLNSFTRLSPASTPTNADTLVFRATFSEDVQNVGTTDFTVNGSTSATVTNVSTVSANVYDITVSGGDLASFNGTVGLDLAAGQDITDLSANVLPTAEPATDEAYTVDNTAPSAPIASSITTDTGTSSSDGVTSDNTLVFAGTAEADSTIEVFINGSSIGMTTTDGSGNWSFDYTGTTLGDGNYSLTAVATDSAGNASPASSAVSITVDTTAPATPSTPDLSSASDSGNSDSDNITNNTTPTFTGTAEANSTITLTSDISGNIGTATADGSGNWSITASMLTAGNHSITATTTDTAGNTSATSAALTLTIDTTAPTVTVDSLNTSDSTPQLRGTVDDNGATIAVTVDSNTYTATNNGDGTWTLADNTISPVLSGGTYDLVIAATDSAGNVGNDSTTNELAIATPTIEFSQASYSANEGDGTTNLITLNRNTTVGTSQVQVAITGGSATDGSDYTGSSFPATVVFNDGENTQTVALPVLDDTIDEPGADETITFALTALTNATIGTQSTAAFNIVDNDDTPNLTVNDVAANEADGTLTFTVSLDGTSAQPITVDYATANETATAGTDYTSSTGTLTWNAGETSQEITIDIADDSLSEGNETFVVDLTNASNANISDGQGQGTIADNDIDYTVSASADITEGDSSTQTVSFTIVRSGDLSGSSSIDYALSGTASQGSDYTNIGGEGTEIVGTLTFARDETEKTITVDVLGDTEVEVDEAIALNLSSPTAPGTATLNVSSASITILNDDIATSGFSVPLSSPIFVGNPGQSASCALLDNPPQFPSINITSNTEIGAATDDVFSGSPLNEGFFGRGGNDTIFGFGGDDNINGEDGEDFLIGNTGKDIIEGGSGNDTIHAGQDEDGVRGNAGDDLIYGDRGNDTVEGNEGNDLLFGNMGNDYIDGGLGADFIHAGQGNDGVRGNEGNDTLLGDRDNDCIHGNEGDDWLFGNTGMDNLQGDTGDDSLWGGQDDDTLFGGLGNDWLSGDLGNDIFVLEVGNGADRIVDFAAGDRIGLSAGLTFDQLQISSNSTGTIISANSQVLAIVENTSAIALTGDRFVTVA